MAMKFMMSPPFGRTPGSVFLSHGLGGVGDSCLESLHADHYASETDDSVKAGQKDRGAKAHLVRKNFNWFLPI
jgi:hypothetical protein